MSQSQTLPTSNAGKDPLAESNANTNTDEVVIDEVDHVDIEEKEEEHVRSLAEVLFADAAIEDEQMAN